MSSRTAREMSPESLKQFHRFQADSRVLQTVLSGKMTKEDKIKYWLKTADHDWHVANHLYEKGDYSYALFFCHLTIEKLLKAIFTKREDKTPPFSHNLV
ncbi:MAG: HEPN domain-containing protein [Proteobacteria bacterium]|nr:HEPN domain-containing protein [Pseudomonadota bacterium]